MSDSTLDSTLNSTLDSTLDSTLVSDASDTASVRSVLTAQEGPAPGTPLRTQEPEMSTPIPRTYPPDPEMFPPEPGMSYPTPEPIDAAYAGAIKISVVSAIGLIPVVGATVVISYTGDPDAPIETLTTDTSGQTPVVELPAPPLDLSLSPDPDQQPYSEYNISVTAPDYEPVLVSGSEIFADQLSLQPIRMNPLAATEEQEKIVVIPAHTLFAEYPPKIPEDEIKPMAETGEIVLSRVVIPEYVIVHDGVPGDPTAANYWVRYKDYIKNVASCEIYSTWSESALYANILVILSFTLNRVYTEW